MTRHALLTFVLTVGLAAGFAAITAHADDAEPGFVSLFNGKDLAGWKVHAGKMDVWGAEDGLLFVKAGGGGWLMTDKEFADFELRFDCRLPKVGNSGVCLRAPRQGDPCYTGIEVQIIDDINWKGLADYQHSGSLYDLV